MKTNIQNKGKLVNSVFSEVHSKYDLMNDIMSLGVHRIWKNKFIDWMNPQPNTTLIDVASGTGDIAKLFIKKSKNTSKIVCVEPNTKMLKQGQNKLSKYRNVRWINSHAEKIPVHDDTFDYYSISYGIRNVSNINFALKEAFRVLKPGGKFLCLEFSKVQNENLRKIYEEYSKLIPKIGDFVVGDKQPYEYLVESIDKFINQEELIDCMKSNNFTNCKYRNFNGGIVAIHSGWKV